MWKPKLLSDFGRAILIAFVFFNIPTLQPYIRLALWGTPMTAPISNLEGILTGLLLATTVIAVYCGINLNVESKAGDEGIAWCGKILFAPHLSESFVLRGRQPSYPKAPDCPSSINSLSDICNILVHTYSVCSPSRGDGILSLAGVLENSNG